MPSDDDDPSRRKVLQMSGIGLAGLVGAPNSAAASPGRGQDGRDNRNGNGQRHGQGRSSGSPWAEQGVMPPHKPEGWQPPGQVKSGAVPSGPDMPTPANGVPAIENASRKSATVTETAGTTIEHVVTNVESPDLEPEQTGTEEFLFAFKDDGTVDLITVGSLPAGELPDELSAAGVDQ